MAARPAHTAPCFHRLALSAALIAAAAALPAVDQGFPNVTQTLPPAAGDGMPLAKFIYGPIEPNQGRTAVVMWHGQRLFTMPEGPGSQGGADFFIRQIDIRNPVAPVSTNLNTRSFTIHAHGSWYSGAYACLGLMLDGPRSGQDVVRLDSPGMFTFGQSESMIGMPGGRDRLAAHGPWNASFYWTYGAVDTNALTVFGVRRTFAEPSFDSPGNWGDNLGAGVKARWPHLANTGVIGMPFLVGNILIYAGENQGRGVATYDVSDPANPVLLDVLKQNNPGGYWPEIYGHYLFFPRRDAEAGPAAKAGYMVVDFSDPTNLRVVAERMVPGNNQYVQFQDEYAFMNRYKIDMRTFDVVMRFPVSDNGQSNDGGPTNVDGSQYMLPLGNLVISGGYGAFGPGAGIWAHQSAPDTRPPFVAYHIPRPDQVNYSTQCPLTFSIPETLKNETVVNGSTVRVRPVLAGGALGTDVDCWVVFSTGALLTVTPKAPLATNTTFQVTLSGIEDAAGNAMEPYSFRFSTGSGLSGGNQPPNVTALNVATSPTTPGTTITFTATATDPNAGDTIQYRIDYGDGTPKTAWQANGSFSKAYSQQGHYTVTVQVRDQLGAVASLSRGVAVVTSPAGTRPTTSGPLGLNAASRRLWVANSDANTVSVVNVDTNAKVAEYPTGADPRAAAVAGDGTVWVPCHDADRVDVLDGTTGAILASLSTGYGSAPVAACASPDGATVYVTCTGDGTLRRFTVSTRSANGSLALGPTPRAIAITGNGQRALITRFISGEHEGSVYDVSLAGGMALTRTIPLRRHWLTDGPANARGVPNYLAGVAITPDNARAWVVGKKDNTERGTLMTPEMALGQDTTVRAQLLVIDLATNAEDQALRMDIDNADSPSALAFSPAGDYAFIALQGLNQLGVVDVIEFMRGTAAKTTLTRMATGLAPQGVAVDAATGRTFVHDFMGRTVTSFATSTLFSSGNLSPARTTIAAVANELLPTAVLQGKRIFYNAEDRRMSAEGYISCATCHIDGSHDGRTWDFTQRGEGLRNTTDLRGRAGIGHGAVHWSANFDEIQDFENDIRGAFGGTGFLTNGQFAATSNPLGSPKAGLNADLDALAAYVTSLGNATLPKSPHRNPDGTRTASGNAGAAIFTQEGCNTCHNPATGFTDRTLRDVGTLRSTSGSRAGAVLSGIDTPTLLGLHAGGPYFHNGSAATLDEVFSIAGGEVRQAESGTMIGGAVPDTITWSASKNWRGGALVGLDADGKGVSFAGINAGTGGPGMIEIRHTVNYGAGNLQVVVNGVTTTVALPVPPNDPSWMPNEWRIVRVPVTFAAGSANVIEIRRGIGGGQIVLDEVTFTTQRDYALAQPHRRVLSLSSGDRQALIDYLRQLDAADAVGGNTPPSFTNAAAATPNPVTGTTTALTSLATDNAGEPALSYTWSVVSAPAGGGASFSPNGTNGAKASTATFTRAGSYVLRVTATDAGGMTAASDVSVTVNQTLTSIMVTPVNPNVAASSVTAFSASGRDQFAQTMATQPTVTWSLSAAVGTITAGGSYTAPGSSGSVQVRATSGAITGTSTVTIAPPPNAPPTVSAATATPSTVTGTTSALSATATDDGGEPALSYTWSMVSGPAGATPTFAPNGNNSAKAATVTFNRAGAYVLRVTATDAGSLTGTRDVNVTVNQTLTAIVVTPNPASVQVNAVQAFTAAGRDQFVQAMAATVTWSVASGGGTITSGGSYTAPMTTGSAVVRAASGAIQGDANVTITPLGSSGLPAGWSGNSVGTGSGSESVSGGTWTITGQGADIWGAADAFRLVSTATTANVTIQARVQSITGTPLHGWAKAGLMVRNGTVANAQHVAVFLSPGAGNGVSMARRLTTGGLTQHTAGSTSGAPRWVRLQRVGTSLTASESADGSTWTTIGTATLTGITNVQVGFAVCSHATTTPVTATFTNVSVSAP